MNILPRIIWNLCRKGTVQNQGRSQRSSRSGFGRTSNLIGPVIKIITMYDKISALPEVQVRVQNHHRFIEVSVAVR